MMQIRLRLGLLAGVAMLLSVGCAQRRGPSQMVADISAPREARKQQVVEDLQQQRDLAEYHAAVTCWEQGNLAGCQRSLQLLLARNPRHFEANYLLAELYFLNDQPEEARLILERLIEQRPEAAVIQHTLSMVLERLGRRDLAIAHARRAIELEPDKERYRDILAALETGDSAASGAVAGQLATYRAPGHSADAAFAGSTSIDGGSGLQESGLPPEFLPACQRGDLHHAKSLLLGAARQAAHDETRLISLAVAAMRQDQPAWAIQVLRTFQTADSASAGYRRALGTAYYHAGEYAAAEVQLRQALLLDNASALSYFLLGCTLSRQQRRAEAETHLRQARLLDSRFDRATLLP